MYTILFVCTGNTCRSPMAMYITKQVLQAKGVKGVRVESRGMFVTEKRLSTNARLALKSFHVQNIHFVAKQLVLADVEHANCIIAMTRQQAMQLALQYPVHAHKITSIARLLQNQKDVLDPYGQNTEAYVQAAKYLEYVAEEIAEKLQKDGKLCLEN